MEENRFSDEKDRKKYSFCVSKLFPIVGIIPLALGIFGAWMTMMNDEGAETKTGQVSLAVALILMGLTVFLIITVKFWTVVEISEKSVKKSFLKVLFKRKILWNELCEITAFDAAMGVAVNALNISFSKSPNKGLSYSKIMRKKDQINLICHKKVYEAFRKFTDKKIVNTVGEVMSEVEEEMNKSE